MGKKKDKGERQRLRFRVNLKDLAEPVVSIKELAKSKGIKRISALDRDDTQESR